ncbi:hypothetical protein F5884DRAFT_805793 [Xylogone sp. PMI_703]|nr:hypothetical protein F5884DRAFT_805793 [Xylogone sp. PMI_703]
MTACGSTTITVGQPNTIRADILLAYLNRTCAIDTTTRELCPIWLSGQVASLAAFKKSTVGSSIAGSNTDSDIAFIKSLPTTFVCSSCFLALYKANQASPYLAYDEDDVALWQQIQSICKIFAPTAVPTSTYNVSQSAAGFANGTAPGSNMTCLSGKTYTVQSGDSCTSIALAHSVGSETLRVINNLTPDCAGLTVGSNLCLPFSCTVARIHNIQDCATAIINNNITAALLLSYNPTLDANCTTPTTNGSIICVSPPFGQFTPTPISGVAATPTGMFATSTVTPPGITARGTTLRCGSWYLAKDGDICQSISLTQAISVDLFLAINPSLDAVCGNLVPGLWYCSQPTADRDSTTVSPGSPSTTQSAIPAPTFTPPGTASDCFQWHVVENGDSCALIESSFGLSFGELTALNPAINATCGNLLLGIAYCVGGVPNASCTTGTSQSAIATPTTTKTSTSMSISSTAPKTTTSTHMSSTTQTTSSKLVSTITTTKSTSSASSIQSHTPAPSPTGCSQTYTVKSGDFCFSIGQMFGITTTQLQQLNPSLDSNCDLVVGQVLCVASTSCANTYIVVSGDICFSIAFKFGISSDQLIQMNNLDSNCDIQIGQRLCV